MQKVQELIGYCPQFDILWNDLTVEEHLYFYSKLKNVSYEFIQLVRMIFKIYIWNMFYNYNKYNNK